MFAEVCSSRTGCTRCSARPAGRALIVFGIENRSRVLRPTTDSTESPAVTLGPSELARKVSPFEVYLEIVTCISESIFATVPLVRIQLPAPAVSVTCKPPPMSLRWSLHRSPGYAERGVEPCRYEEVVKVGALRIALGSWVGVLNNAFRLAEPDSAALARRMAATGQLLPFPHDRRVPEGPEQD